MACFSPLENVDYTGRPISEEEIHINRFAAAELVQFHIDAAGIRASGIERLAVYDHAVDGTVLGKVRYIRKFGGVIS